MSLVCSKLPHIILKADRQHFEMFGYDARNMVGESIFRLVGPESDPVQLQAAIASSEASTAQFVLYNRHGIAINCMVTCKPCWRDGSNVGCLMYFHPSGAVTLLDALGYSKQPQLLVSSESPNCIHTASDDFLLACTVGRAQILGKALDSIVRTKPTAWNAVVSSALRGNVAYCAVECSSMLREFPCATVFPVVDTPNGRIRNLLVRFHQDVSKQATFPADSPLPTAPALEPSAQAVPERSRDMGHAIFPRRRHGQPQQAPVVVTPDMLQGLRGLQLREAARAVGVSVTAFKRACRRLGLRRWTYKRGPAARSKRTFGASAEDGGGADSDDGEGSVESCGSPHACGAGASPGPEHAPPRCGVVMSHGVAGGLHPRELPGCDGIADQSLPSPPPWDS